MKNCLSPAQVLAQVNAGVAATEPGVLAANMPAILATAFTTNEPAIIATALNTAMPEPYLLVQGSPDQSLHRLAGRLISKELTIVGNNAELVSNIFTMSGNVEILALYGIFTGVTEVTKIQGCWFDLWDGTNSVAMTLDGVSCNGATLESVILKDQDATAAAYFGNASQVRYREAGALRRALYGGWVTAKPGVTNYIRFRTDTDANTSAKIWFACSWVCREPNASDYVAPV